MAVKHLFHRACSIFTRYTEWIESSTVKSRSNLKPIADVIIPQRLERGKLASNRDFGAEQLHVRASRGLPIKLSAPISGAVHARGSRFLAQFSRPNRPRDGDWEHWKIALYRKLVSYLAARKSPQAIESTGGGGVEQGLFLGRL